MALLTGCQYYILFHVPRFFRTLNSFYDNIEKLILKISAQKRFIITNRD